MSLSWLGPRVRAKVEYESPTGSFKDRGAVMVIAAAVDAGAREVTVDSSGNAAVAFAAYAARAGLTCHVFVPEAVSPAKLARARVHGADVRVVRGDRAAAARAAIGHVESTGSYYASHVWNPWFFEGTKRLVLELDSVPSTLVLPVGNGTLVLGAMRAFASLGTTARIVAVRPADVSATLAEGIAVPSPPRWDEVRRAVEVTGGEVVTVTDDEICDAQGALATHGYRVEPTGAVAVAAVTKRFANDDVLVPLTGAGR